MKHKYRRTPSIAARFGFGFAGSIALVMGAGAAAAQSPDIMASGTNVAPQCATPGKLQAFLKARNPRLDARFDRIAQVYAKVGQELGVRYDYVFFQMMADTGSLSFKGTRARLVKAEQNNFAGIGAVGSAEPGESFPDIETGVRAHFQHVMLYAGQQIEAPVAERTRKVQDWNILAAWQSSLGAPVTFEEMAKKWSSPTSVYPSLIEGHATAFRTQFCGGEVPQDEVPVAQMPRPRGQDLAKQAPAVAKAEGLDRRSALGAGGIAKASPQLNIINRDPPPAAEPPSRTVAAVVAPRSAPPAAPPAARPVQPVAAPGSAATALPRSVTQPNGPVPGGKCRVWTASYGGNRGVIVRWMKDGIMNFTVIDVNQGQEGKEAQAFIGGYTKDGALVGTFPTQAQALEKAFEYCPEG